MSLEKLRKIYFSIDSLSWVDVTPADQEQGGKMGSMGEHWPGRAETCHRRDVVLLDRQRAAIEAVAGDEGIFFLPTGRAGGRELIDLAMKLVGSRCLVNRLGHDTSKNSELLGGDFVRGLEDDRRLAETCRTPLEDIMSLVTR